MPRYPSSYYGFSTAATINNNVTRRLDIRDTVSFGQSTRFGGQYIEPRGLATPWGATIRDAQAACHQLINEFNLIAPVFPDMGTPVVLSSVGVASNLLGAGVSFIGAIPNSATFDGVSLSTGLRVLFFGLSTAALNGVYTVSTWPYVLRRSSDLTSWWQYSKPKAFVVTGGTNNRGKVFTLQTDAREIGNTFSIASGVNASAVTGTSIALTDTNFDPNMPSGLGFGNTSLIAGNQTGAEGLFLAQVGQQKFMYIRNRAQRLAYQIFKMRENFTPAVSSYPQNQPAAIGLGVTNRNIGFSTNNDLPAGSRYPSSQNRGF